MTDQAHLQTIDTPFVDKTYAEAMALVHRTAAYLEGEGGEHRDELDDALRPVFTAESLRVTTRLMQVVSWLMIQRAVLAGEMDRKEANAEKHQLGARSICMAEPLDGAEKLPDVLHDLAHASRGIYERVARIEERQLRGEDSNPVHSLLDRLDKS